MGAQADGPLACEGTGGRRPPVLSLEGVQGRSGRGICHLYQGPQKSMR